MPQRRQLGHRGNKIMNDDEDFMREVENGTARFGYRPIKPSVAAAALLGPIECLRTPWQKWPWPQRMDYFLGTRPMVELLAQGPRGDIDGWLKALRIVVGTTFFTARGRAWLRWHWDSVHNSSGRPELRRKLGAHERLIRIRSKYWLQPWYLDDLDGDNS